jgi:predicted DNA-binding protein with PD1-like motif
MNVFSSDAGVRTHLLGIEPGEDMLKSITDYIGRKGIRTGAVVSGIGTLDQCIMHMVVPGSRKSVIHEFHDTPLEVVGMQGVIADGQPHIHFSISTAQAGLSGHPHEGCRVQYLIEVVILEFLGLNLTRVPHQPHGIEVLSEKAA